MESARVIMVLMFFCFVTNSLASQAIVDFMIAVNGRYDNYQQVADEAARNSKVRHAPSNGTFQPVEIPAMGQVPVFLLEQVFFNQVVRREILVVREREDGSIQLSPYNFTGNFLAKAGEFDVNSLKSLTLDDFSTVGNCDGRFIQVGPGDYIGRWPNCKATENGVHPDYIFELSCDAMLIEAVQGALEHSPEPYILLLQGKKFPLPEFLGDIGDENVCS